MSFLIVTIFILILGIISKIITFFTISSKHIDFVICEHCHCQLGFLLLKVLFSFNIYFLLFFEIFSFLFSKSVSLLFFFFSLFFLNSFCFSYFVTKELETNYTSGILFETFAHFREIEMYSLYFSFLFYFFKFQTRLITLHVLLNKNWAILLSIQNNFGYQCPSSIFSIVMLYLGCCIYS